MAIPSPVVEFYMGGSWVNVSGWVDLGGEALTIHRGRDNEQAAVEAGTCAFSLVNDDGRFTVGNTAGSYSPNFKLWLQVRVTINGAREFTGYMSQASTSWDDDTGLHAHTAVTCMDLLGMMRMSPAIDSWAEVLIGALSPTYWWKMNGIAINTSAAEAGGGPSLAGSVLNPGTDLSNPALLADTLAFGTQGPQSLEADGMAQFTRTNTGGMAALTCTLGTLPASFTVLFMSNQVGGRGSLLVQLLGATGGQLNVVVDATVLSVSETDTTPTTATVGSGGGYSPVFKDTPHIVAVTFTPTTISYVGGATATRPPVRSTYSNGTLQISGRYGVIQSAHLAIIPGVMSSAAFSTLKSQLLADGSGPVSDWLTRAAIESGYAASVAVTYDRAMERPTLKGSNPAEMGATLANSAGALFTADRGGTPTWFDSSYCPACIHIATGEWERRSRWEPDQSLYYSEIRVGGVTAGTVAGAFPRRSLDVEPLLLADEQARYATYLVNAADIITGPRLSQIGIDLATVPTPATYQAIGLRSRIDLQAVPNQIPADGVMTVEGYTLSISADTWDLTLNTAPDPSFVLEDNTTGLLNGDYRLGF